MNDKEYFYILRNQLNASYLEAVESGHENITFYRDTFEKLSILSHRNKSYDDLLKGKIREFAVAPKDDDELFDAIYVMENALKSKWANLEDRKIIFEKSKNTLIHDWSLTEEGYLQFIDHMENRVLPALINKFEPPSKLVLYVQSLCDEYGYGEDVEIACYEYVARRYGKNRGKKKDDENIMEMYQYANQFFARKNK